MTANQLTPKQTRMMRMLVAAGYDQDLTFETDNGNHIRTLRALSRKGLVRAEEHIDRPGLWFAYPAAVEVVA